MTLKSAVRIYHQTVSNSQLPNGHAVKDNLTSMGNSN